MSATVFRSVVARIASENIRIEAQERAVVNVSAAVSADVPSF